MNTASQLDTYDLMDASARGEGAEPPGQDNIIKLEALHTAAGEPSWRMMGPGVSVRMNKTATSHGMHELGVGHGKQQINRMTIARRRMTLGKMSSHRSYHIAMLCRSFSFPKAFAMR